MTKEDPSFWTEMATSASWILTFLIAYLRAKRDGKDWQWSVLEAGVLAITAFGLSQAISVMGLSKDWAWGVSVFIGYLSVDWIAEKIKAKLEKV